MPRSHRGETKTKANTASTSLLTNVDSKALGNMLFPLIRHHHFAIECNGVRYTLEGAQGPA